MAVYKHIDPRPAPKSLKGPWVWMQKNLFSSPIDIIQTIVIVSFLLWIVPPFLNWAVFDASFMGSTKADATGSGANWIFIKEKIGMFIYGFYPESELYRVNIVFGLFFVTVLFFKYIAKTFWQKFFVFLSYPIVAFILIKGGYFGLEMIPTDKWGGLLLTLIIASVGIVLSIPLGTILALGRHSRLPIIKNLSVN